MKRHTWSEKECPENLLRARTSSFTIERISGALCEAVKLNQQWLIEKALNSITVEELEQLLELKRLEAAQDEG